MVLKTFDIQPVGSEVSGTSGGDGGTEASAWGGCAFSVGVIVLKMFDIQPEEEGSVSSGFDGSTEEKTPDCGEVIFLGSGRGGAVGNGFGGWGTGFAFLESVEKISSIGFWPDGIFGAGPSVSKTFERNSID